MGIYVDKNKMSTWLICSKVLIKSMNKNYISELISYLGEQCYWFKIIDLYSFHSHGTEGWKI